MCPIHDQAKLMGRPVVLMEESVFDQVLGQISDRPRELWLNIIGEPTLHPKLLPFVEKAKARGHRVSFTTNGTKMTEALAHGLARHRIDGVVFSIDGFSKGTYEKIRILGHYEEVVANVVRYCAIKKAENPGSAVRVDCIDNDLTRPELDEFRAFWSQHADAVNILPLDDWTGQLVLPEALGKRNSIRKSYFVRHPCHLLWTNLYVSAEGRLMLCCHDFKFRSNLSAVGAENLRTLWNTEIARYRREHVEGNTSTPCANCDAWKTMPRRYSESTFGKIARRVETAVAKKVEQLRGSRG
jgi:hypothetical protein